ncbi:hypothetical protein [uncultured Roseobacter sp.]|uniref:hypothetical protein n=1 Tax=uncultured Roseobacter sp. TaxID=114847 RepID=UPI00261FB12D|nr:hypothetical protein [uncultured Roseobacter sp.]
MGDEYKVRMSRLFAKRDEMSKQIRTELSQFPPEQLEQSFGTDGKTLSEDAKQFVARYRKEVEVTFGRLKPWYSAPLFGTKQLADFEHWAKHEFLSLDEVVWLSVGFEPEQQFVASIKEFDQLGSRQKADEVTTYMSRHREIIRRKFDPYDQRNKPKFGELFTWLNEVNLTVHSGFYDLVSRRAATAGKGSQPDLTNKNDGKLDGRERASLVKLIAAMAIDAYGFDPKEKRSDIPNEIEGIADRLGLNLTSKTIRKYLREGSEKLPEDWKPE